MGRTPTRNKNLPAGMRARHRGSRTYYYLDTGAKPRREIPLGSDYVAAVQKWAELTSSNAKAGEVVTFRHVAERYMREVLPTKGKTTQKDNLRELSSLYKFFDAPPVALEDIEPFHVRQFLDWRGQTAKVRANREKALFSHIWNFARANGMTNKANPCAGIRGHREAGRDVYVEDEVYNAVHEAAEPWLRDALDLAYLTGQRPGDVRKMTRADIKDGALHVQQDKTGAKLRLAVEGQLKDVLERIAVRNAEQKVTSMHLIPLTKSELRGAFDRARDAAKAKYPELSAKIKQFQFRDLRAKAGTDKEEREGMGAARDQLGHTTEAMTRHYVRHRKGKLVTPTK